MPETPNTDSYYYLGLAVVSAITGLYVLSLVLRFRSTKQLVKMLESLKDQ